MKKLAFILLLFFMFIEKSIAQNITYNNYLCIVVEVDGVKNINGHPTSTLKVVNRNVDVNNDGRSDYFELLDKDIYNQLNIEEVFGSEYLLQYNPIENKIKLQTYNFHMNNTASKNVQASYIAYDNNTTLLLEKSDEQFTAVKIREVNNNSVDLTCTALEMKDITIINKLQSKENLKPAFYKIFNYK